MEKFPDDHVTTIGILSEHLTSIDDAFFNEILSTVNPREANEKMLNAMILLLREDDQIMSLCRLFKMLIKSARFCEEMLDFEISTYVHMYILYVCMHLRTYVYMYACTVCHACMMCACMNMFMYVCVCLSVCLSVCMYVCM